MTRWMLTSRVDHPRERQPFDPVVEGARYRLSPEVLRAIWDQTRAGATDRSGRTHDEAARQEFHALATRIAAGGGRLTPDPGRVTRVSVEIAGSSSDARLGDGLHRRVPGRDTLVLAEARRRMAQDEPAADPLHSAAAGARAARVFPGQLARAAPMQSPPAAHVLRRRADAGEIDPDHPAVRAALGQAGAGARLPDELRRPLEARFGFRLGRVRLHTDAVAAAACAALQAHAFTVGEDVFFAAGAWSPSSATGLRLLTHEVAHVVQGYQGRVPSAASPTVSDPADALEREAEAEAARAPASPAEAAPREAPPLAAEGVVHRAAITLRNGHRVTDVTPGAADNKREDVLALLERLRLLGTMDDDFFVTATQVATAVASITALSAGATVTAADLGVVAQLIDWNDSAFLPPSAVQHYMGIAITAPVGQNAISTSNRKDELLLVIDRLNFLGLHPSAAADRAGVAALATPAVAVNQIPSGTYAALRAFRRGIAAGTLGWQSVRGNERENDADRFAGQTASVEVSVLANHPTVRGREVRDTTENIQVSVFLPRNLGDDNKVFVFFSPGDGTEQNPAAPGGNATNVHGLRAPADDSGWILIGVPGWGDPNSFGERGWNTINTAAIQTCLARAGRSTTISVTRFAAHSRGGRGMERTLARGLVAPAPTQITRLEAPGSHGQSRARPVASEDIRAIGYARLIQDRTDVPAPAGVMALIRPLLADLPPRGQFTTHTGAAAAGRVNMRDWVTHHRAHLDAIRAVDDPAEREWFRWLGRPQTQLNHAIVDPSPYFFVNTQDLMRFFGTPLINAAGQPVAGGFSQGIYAHHLYVAEIANELFE